MPMERSQRRRRSARSLRLQRRSSRLVLLPRITRRRSQRRLDSRIRRRCAPRFLLAFAKDAYLGFFLADAGLGCRDCVFDDQYQGFAQAEIRTAVAVGPRSRSLEIAVDCALRDVREGTRSRKAANKESKPVPTVGSPRGSTEVKNSTEVRTEPGSSRRRSPPLSGSRAWPSSLSPQQERKDPGLSSSHCSFLGTLQSPPSPQEYAASRPGCQLGGL